MIYNPPKQYESTNTGSIVSSVSGIVGAIPGPIGWLGKAGQLIGNLLNVSEQNNVEQSQLAIDNYNKQYTQHQRVESLEHNALLDAATTAQRYGQTGGRSYVRQFGTSAQGVGPSPESRNEYQGLINNRLI